MIDFSNSPYCLPLEVLVDDREPERLFLEFGKRRNLLVTKKRLFAGDILLDDELLVERKTVLDFCQSLKDGRLFNQVIKMSKTKTKAILVIEGNEENFEKYGFKAEAIQGAIASISLKFNIPVLRSKNVCQTVEILLQCYRQLEKANTFQFPKVFRKIKKTGHYYDPVLLQKLKILTSFPGLGLDRSLLLIEKFHRLERLFASSKDEFLSIKGIGPKIWSDFHKILRE
jgi:ERCC4-type nuclease